MLNRQQSIQSINDTSEWDIIIIGGGATGLGCAIDAASRGYKTLLLEKHDFAKGTSSRATKLVHGGVRYLAQGNIRLVAEALKERGRLLSNAPHVCHRLAFVVPFYNQWQKWYYWFGLWFYQLLSGSLSLGKTKFLSRQGTLRNLPNLNADRLAGGVLYFDGQFDDSRLAINMAQTAAAQGATVINYFGVEAFVKVQGLVKGVIARDALTNMQVELRSKVIINATGVFADAILQLAAPGSATTIAPSQGIHLVVDQHFFSGKAALMVPKTDDGRVLFAIPWHGKLLLGTTDTPVAKINTEPLALKAEIDFVLKHFNRYSNSSIHYRDVQSVFVGLRPLAKTSNQSKTAVMPRDHHVAVLPSGLIHVTGGKWTTYRSMAEHAVNVAAKAVGLSAAACRTSNLHMHGYSLDAADSHWSVYGTDAPQIKELMNRETSLKALIHPAYPYTLAEVTWMVRNEMAITLEDVLARRIRLLFLDARAAIEAAPVVRDAMAKELHWSSEEQERQLNEFVALAKQYLPEE